jgi:hypothetical protein
MAAIDARMGLWFSALKRSPNAVEHCSHFPMITP